MSCDNKSIKVHEFMEFVLFNSDKRILIRVDKIVVIQEEPNCSVISCVGLDDIIVKNTYDEIKESNQR